MAQKAQRRSQPDAILRLADGPELSRRRIAARGPRSKAARIEQTHDEPQRHRRDQRGHQQRAEQGAALNVQTQPHQHLLEELDLLLLRLEALAKKDEAAFAPLFYLFNIRLSLFPRLRWPDAARLKSIRR